MYVLRGEDVNTKIVLIYDYEKNSAHLFDFQGHSNVVPCEFACQRIISLKHGYFALFSRWSGGKSFKLMKVKSDLTGFTEHATLSCPKWMRSDYHVAYDEF